MNFNTTNSLDFQNQSAEGEQIEQMADAGNIVEEVDNEEWERLKIWAATCVVGYASYAACIALTLRRFGNSGRSISEVADYERHALMERLTNMNDEDCYNQLRMRKHAFANLVSLLKGRGLLKDNPFSRVEEQVAKFLIIIGHNLRTRNINFFFQRSTETVSRHFHQVLRAIISLDNIFLKQPTGLECPPEIRNNLRFWPYFQDCVGAIDGSHFRVKVSNSDVQRYRGRKCFPTQNVLAACSFDLKFTYILPGWEGSASDSRILNDSLTREEDRLIVPRGKYYLVDAGYQLKTGFLAPFRGKRYHLKEYSVHQPQDLEELFNLRHASLRNTIERAFGVLKKRFPMLASGSETFYDVDTQGDIIIAGCILHNYLLGMDPIDSLIEEVDRELMNEEIPLNSRSSLTDDCREGEIWRMQIATDMWQNYNVH